MTISPTELDCFKVLRTFLLSVLPLGADVIRGQVNRVPEPLDANFIVVWGLRRPRLATNIDSEADVRLTGSISGTTLTVSDVSIGTITVPSVLFGPDVAAGTTIAAQLSGPSGGAGTYTVSPSQTVPSETLSAGGKDMTQEAEFVFQLDSHGPNSADNATIISTALRDDYAVEVFASLNPNISPLYADDPKQMPFINDQQQYEDRWIVEAHLQVNTTFRVPQEFADTAEVDVINVEATYPP